jgi:acetyl-CoA carboxylase biotin carboxyl carrier protein
MALDDDDVREILRIIDESDLAELRIETEGLSLHVLRDRAAPQREVPSSDGDGARDGLEIVAPMLGTFYRSPAPGEPPFVNVGERVDPDTIVCIIEVMKMMNSVQAGVAGTIAEIRVENAQPVEYGQVLFRVEPA